MNKPKNGFTLIELLVVIAIIAILAAILFPVFAKAREKARQTTCASNEKQLALGIIQYVQDFDEYFPPRTESYSATQGDYWPAFVYPYIKSAAVFICPDDSGNNNMATSVSAAEPHTFGVNDFSDESYGYSLAFGANNTSSTSIKLSQINFPSELGLLVEDFGTPMTGVCFGSYSGGYAAAETTQNQGFALVWYAGMGTPVSGSADPPGLQAGVPFNSGFDTPTARHTGSAEVAFSDGHVKNVTYSSLYAPPTGTTNLNFRLWHADAM